MASLKLQISSLNSSWSKFCALTWQERRLLLQAFVILLLVAAGLHLMNFQRLRALLTRLSPVTQDVSGESVLQQAAILSRLVQAAAARMPFTITCLVRSTALWFLLRRRGIASEIRIGVNRQDSGFQAHAWVEIDGIVINDRGDIQQQFVPFEQTTMPDGTERI